MVFERTTCTDVHLFYLLNNVGGLLIAKCGVIMLCRLKHTKKYCVNICMIYKIIHFRDMSDPSFKC